MAVRLLAAAAFLLLLGVLFRLAMALRYARLRREGERRAEEARGRRVVAEAPDLRGEIGLVLEDAAALYWAGGEVRKRELRGAQLLLNRRVLEQAARAGAALAAPSAGAEDDGVRERWDVALHLESGEVIEVPCGTLREGVSREAARAVFAAASRAVAAVER
ncbi:MAG: hypothetical protein AB7O37_18910 [Vicinamibacteria bacterium]